MGWRSDRRQRGRGTPMIRRLILLAAIAAVLGLAAFWYLTAPASVPASALAAHTPDLANGKEMFYASGCASCHAVPKQPDKTRLGGGLALNSPFGTFYVPNISSDPKDGIGAWTDAQFITALTKGTSPEGEHYYPAFPSTSYQHMRFDDLRDLFAHRKTLPSVPGSVRDHDLPFPFNIRRTLGLWKLLFLDGKPFESDPSRSTQWNRGAYLVNGPGHCAECHSPRNALGGTIASLRFTGGPSPDGPGGRQHGRGGAQYLATDRRGSHGDRGLYQVAAGGRRAQAAAEEAGITRRPKPGLMSRHLRGLL